MGTGRAVAAYCTAAGGGARRGGRRRARDAAQRGLQAAVQALGLPEPSIVSVPAPTTLKAGRQALATRCCRRRTGSMRCSAVRPHWLRWGCSPKRACRGWRARPAGQVGFGDLAFAADLAPALSSVRIKGDAIGRQAARFIVDRVEGREVPERVIDIGFEIVERQSS